MLNIIALLLIIIFFIIILIQEILFKKKGIEGAGKPPINKKLFIIGKLSMLTTWISLLVQSLNCNLRIYDIPEYIEVISIIIEFLGFIIIILSFLYLGESNRMGLPNEKTKLKTSGIYKLSRNPMYLGFILYIIAAVIYTFNPLILLLALIAIIIHHKIICSEEEYLKQAFGDEFLEYMKKVRRYI